MLKETYICEKRSIYTKSDLPHVVCIVCGGGVSFDQYAHCAMMTNGDDVVYDQLAVSVCFLLRVSFHNE